MSESNLVQNLNHLKSLPSSWIINEFKQVVSDNSGGNKKLAKSDFLDEGEIAIVDQGKELIAGYFDDVSLSVKTPPPYVVFGDHTRAFKYIDFPFVMGADGTKVLQPKKDDCDTKYLYYFFLSINVPDTGYNRHFKYLKQLKIPLPPLDQQKKIASILDAADAYRQKTKALIEKYDELTQSLFISMFGDPVTNPKGWQVLTFKDVMEIRNGKNQKSIENQNGKYPICGSGGIMSYGDDFISEANSVIIGRKGNINKPILMKEKYWHVDTAFGLNPNRNTLGHDYLYWFCVRYNFEQHNKTVTIPSLTKETLLRIKIPTPTIDLQNNFEERVKAIEAQKAQAQESLAKVEDLFNSLLQKAFKGELTN